MQKIISLFQRNYHGDRLVRNELVPGAEWVFAGEGVATRKFDGTCCMVRDGKLYKRYDAKAGKTPPLSFLPAQPEADLVTGHWPGWIAVGDGPEDRWHREAFANALRFDPPVTDGTYELCGPCIQGNPEKLPEHTLVPHGIEQLHNCPRDFDGIREYLRYQSVEGIVWWRDISDQDCEKVKIKLKDFGLKRQ